MMGKKIHNFFFFCRILGNKAITEQQKILKNGLFVRESLNHYESSKMVENYIFFVLRIWFKYFSEGYMARFLTKDKNWILCAPQTFSEFFS